MLQKTPDQAFRQLLETLVSIQAIEWQREEEKASNYAVLREGISRTLYRFLNQRVKFDDNPLELVVGRQLILLPPLQQDRHLVPFLTLSYDGNGDDDSCCRLYILLLGLNRNQVYGIGFRIESPERNCQEEGSESQIGVHDFYHSQLILNLEKYNWPPIYRTFSQLPTSQPSFPLWAITPFDALLNLILTLYGARYYLLFLRNHGQSLASAMSPEFKRLNARLQSK